jgi:uncharacterized membrane protein YkvI
MTDKHELIALAERVEEMRGETFWYCRRIGAYALFAYCAFATATVTAILIAIATDSRSGAWWWSGLNGAIMVLVFMTLRDLSRNPFKIVADTLRIQARKAERERQQ